MSGPTTRCSDRGSLVSAGLQPLTGESPRPPARGGSMTRAEGPAGRAAGGPLAAATGGLTIERLVAVDAPREVRVHPRDRVIAYTRESVGARQIFVAALRGGAAVPVTAS